MSDVMKNGVAGDSTGREVKKVTRLHTLLTRVRVKVTAMSV